MTDSRAERDRLTEALPRYEIGGELGQGAFGVVRSGRHRQLGRDVAIKQLPPVFAADPAVRERFAAEARVLASLDHPHIVPIFDYVEREGLCALVMEHLPGGSVRLRQQEGMTPQQACAIALATCAALDFAHERGVLHRDIKPDNLLFTANRMLKVTDFGIAKVVGATMATRVGETLGTPAYMAPEQCLGRPPGPGTDIYATGVMLYELLAGHLPFSDDGDALALLYRHVHEAPPPLAAAAPDLPEGLGFTVMRAMAKDPADRYPTAEAFGVALAETATAAWGVGWLASAGLKVMAVGPIHTATERPSIPPLIGGEPILGSLAEPPAVPAGPTRVVAPLTAATVSVPLAEFPPVPPAGAWPDEAESQLRTQPNARPGAPPHPGRETGGPPTLAAQRLDPPQQQETLVVHRPATPTTERSKERSRRRRLAAIAAAVIVVAGGATAAITQFAGSAGAHPATTYAFSPQSYPSGLVVDRLWTLSGRSGSQLQGTVTISNEAKTAIHGSYTEVLPKSVASTVQSVTFAPPPAQIVQADPVVRYEVDLLKGGSFKLTYSASVGKTSGSWFSRLTQLAAAQTAAQTSYLRSIGEKVPATLASLSVSRGSLSLTEGQSATLTLSGKMSDGTAAPHAALQGVAWSSVNSKIASVANGTVTAVGSGATTVTAQAGFLTESVDVKVTGSSTPSSSSSTSTSGSSTTVPRSTTTVTVSPSKPHRTHTTSPAAPNSPATTPPTARPEATTVPPSSATTATTTAPTTVPISATTTLAPTTTYPTTTTTTTPPTTTTTTTAPTTTTTEAPTSVTAPPTTLPPTTPPATTG